MAHPGERQVNPADPSHRRGDRRGEECPVDRIDEGARKLSINPFECIDCGACEPACPVEAIGEYPGGAQGVGAVAADTDLVANFARQA